MLRLALPLVFAEIGWMSMGLVDTVMVGRLPNAAVAMSSVALAQVLYNTLAFGVGGVLLGLDTVIAQSHGAGKIEEANRWLVHGLILAAAVAALLTGIFALAPLGMERMHTDAVVLAGAVANLKALNVGILPLLLYFTLRRYLQAFNHVRPIAGALLSANLVNIFFNWLLIYGHTFRLGAHTVHLHPMGVVGSGLSTTLARVYQAIFLAVAIFVVNRRHGYGLSRISLRAEWLLLRRLLALGLPAGATILVEISIFAIVSFLISTLGPLPLAGHEIALNCASFTFMVPMGISSAAAVRVGQALGRGDISAARSAGWTAVGLSTLFMLCSAAVYLAVPYLIARTFTPDPLVIAATVPLLGVAAIFQIFDGLQITVIGALRGAGDTRSGLLTHLCCYWLLGLPVGLYLGLSRGLGARGLWLGLCSALVVAGSVLLFRWRHVSRSLVPDPLAPDPLAAPPLAQAAP